jgi:hypothetical protein
LNAIEYSLPTFVYLVALACYGIIPHKNFCNEVLHIFMFCQIVWKFSWMCVCVCVREWGRDSKDVFYVIKMHNKKAVWREMEILPKIPYCWYEHTYTWDNIAIKAWNLRIFMDFFGFFWIFSDFFGFLWIFMDFFGVFWIFMDFFGFFWIFFLNNFIF